MSEEKGRTVTFQELVNILRGNIVLSYDGAKETALRSFDQIVKKLDEQLQINNALRETKEKPILEEKKKK